MQTQPVLHRLSHMVSEHPTVIGFRWSHVQSWGATWAFLFSSISFYFTLSTTLHVILLLFRHRSRPVPVGPIPAVHSLIMSVVSATILAGTLTSAAAEIRDTRWLWGRSKTTIHWLLCFPLGTRSSGRVFFWSYAFYLSRYLHVMRTFFTILRKRRLSLFHLFVNSIPIMMSFLWLEFSQSFQVLQIVFIAFTDSVVYGYRFWIEFGLPTASFPLVANIQMMLLVLNFICHCGVLFLQVWGGGCNGIGAWVFNSVINGAFLFMFLNSFVRMRWIRRKALESMSTNGKID
ncbi:putative ELO family protein [Helianthus annuus]|uniref:ELO family protein n=1 Tax=Helianthus annuus TaxID=4232 RepID=A0A251TZ37_HELAN|nr:elongation of fatty acids protein 3-like [Helianthus annuus]KAF5792446.1 putative ELO family protein [Helianthus annuus]KAJ0527387.1 putative ELO family protein [Helianthus annuus]KAJ0543789.1 putative ELO family protein [Helianthus annuus]KAJ0708842.1 putative ELO family protein [Helianthus annuus]KAJ0889921.1 putative ELO family protein [Helianthus annuus]